MLEIEKIKDRLKKVYDPEIGVNIVDLGLIYNIDVDENNNVKILMTLTVPGCPLANMLQIQTQKAVESMDGVNSAVVELTFEPPWKPEMMSETARRQLGWA